MLSFNGKCQTESLQVLNINKAANSYLLCKDIEFALVTWC